MAQVESTPAAAGRRLALVTGASSGLGEAFARAYAARGCDLAITARRRDRLEALSRELSARHGVEVLVIPADLSVGDGHRPIVEAIEGAGREIDILVNNAGFGIAQTFNGVPWERQRDFLMTLVVSACALAHAAIPGMVERRWGRIVNVASLAAFAPGAVGHSLYPGAKSLMLKFSQSLAAELADKGIKVTAVCPGFTRTEFAEAEGTQHLMDQAPRRFWQSAEEVVHAAIDANERGKVVEIPGWHNRLAATLLRTLPDALVSALIARGGAKYRLED